jgi:hypothetical protein
MKDYRPHAAGSGRPALTTVWLQFRFTPGAAVAHDRRRDPTPINTSPDLRPENWTIFG